MTAKDTILKNINLRGTMSRADFIRLCARESGHSEVTIRQYLAVLEKSNTDIYKHQSEKPTTKKSMLDFKKKYDVPFKIREGIKTHLEGEVYLTDQEFREACKIPSNGWRRYASREEFADNQGKFSGEHLWSNKDMMDEMKHIAGGF